MVIKVLYSFLTDFADCSFRVNLDVLLGSLLLLAITSTLVTSGGKVSGALYCPSGEMAPSPGGSRVQVTSIGFPFEVADRVTVSPSPRVFFSHAMVSAAGAVAGIDAGAAGGDGGLGFPPAVSWEPLLVGLFGTPEASVSLMSVTVARAATAGSVADVAMMVTP